jgi:hypothetical protein
MTSAEVEKYINQLVFSGAEEFLENTKIQIKTPRFWYYWSFWSWFYSALW